MSIDQTKHPAAFFANNLLTEKTLEAKLAPGPSLNRVEATGPILRLSKPARCSKLTFVKGVKIKVPPLAGMRDKDQRARILHALANHELQAAELFAWAILAFGDAPKSFRRGLLHILGEEQDHCRLYIERINALGYQFGDFPVSGHFWHHLEPIRTPLDFVCTMGLTYEHANLDFAQEYESAAREAGDLDTANTLAQVHRDEIGHVAFAWRWMLRLKNEDEPPLDAYQRSVTRPLGLHRARGKNFDKTSRMQAGLDPSFCDAVEFEVARRPNGLPR